MYLSGRHFLEALLSINGTNGLSKNLKLPIITYHFFSNKSIL